MVSGIERPVADNRKRNVDPAEAIRSGHEWSYP